MTFFSADEVKDIEYHPPFEVSDGFVKKHLWGLYKILQQKRKALTAE